MYTCAEVITSYVRCRVDGYPLNYCGEKACSYRLLTMSPVTLLLVSSGLCVDDMIGLVMHIVMGRNAQEAGGSLVHMEGAQVSEI